ncbi:MAG: DUF423 domain-containing protein, partial [Flavobacteriales bacterium]|nr:DUF423 domain-containing protein [Flavobacteriales bacterium]
AIGLGALGAHSLKGILTPEQLKSFETGSEYHIYHTIALLLLVALSNTLSKKTIKATSLLWGSGIVLFSGSIYLLATREVLGIDSWTGFLGPITPIGGLCFIAGWATLIYAGIKDQTNE